MKKKEITALVIIILAATFTGLFLSPLASVHPDGLERVAEDYGFIDKAKSFENINFLIPDYEFPGVENSFWKTALSGFAGVIIMLAIFGIIYFIIYFAMKDKNNISNKNKLLK